MKYFYLYLAVINLIAMIVTVHDKNAAEKKRWRIRERTLMLIALLGGSPMMYLTMLTISHKTRKPLFMVGIPVVFLVELSGVLLILHYGFGII